MSDVVDVFVHLGRGHVRAVVGGAEYVTARGAGLGDGGGSDQLVAVVVDAVRALLAIAGGERRGPAWRLVVASPGVASAPALAAVAARELGAAFTLQPVAVLLVGEGAAWQAGAFDGRDGAAVVIDTGTVVVIRDGAAVTRLDGLGLLLGDVGGAAWTGRAALQRAAVTAGPLHDAAIARYGPSATWTELVQRPDVPAQLAAFAPDVVRLAADGDTDARAVVTLAARGVAATLSVVPPDLELALVGRFAAALTPRLQALLPDRSWVSPVGDVVAGLRVLVADPGPFEREIARAEPATGGARPETDPPAPDAAAEDTDDLDVRPTTDLVRRLVDGHDPALRTAHLAVPALARAADLAAHVLRDGGRLVYVGAGTPGRIAVQDAAELTPTFGLDPARAVVLLAGGPAAARHPVADAEDDADAGRVDVDTAGVGPADVVIAVSASGRTPYVLAAAGRARERGAPVIGVSGPPGSLLSRVADVAVDLPTGPEVIAGSTRLAAGTAQKIALNTLSTAALVRAGATYGSWPVDVPATGDRLRRRALRIVRAATGADDATATAALAAAGDAVPVALVMVLAGLDAPAARARLAAAGTVRAAVRP